MGAKTGISWAESTWNPIRGCSPISSGCTRCYAARMASRFNGLGQPYAGLAVNGRWTGNVALVENHLDDPMKWRKPRRIFVNSMSDLFHENVPDSWVDIIFRRMAEAQHHQFIVLTKRPGRMIEWFQSVSQCLKSRITRILANTPWPLPNVWIGVTAEDQQRADERIPLLLECPAVVRFVSVEPMLGSVDLWPDTPSIDWVIAGCESGPGARPMDLEWVRHLHDQCVSAAVPFFLKQAVIDGTMVKMPALDGRVWDQMPEL